jgi:hypothetical protein
MFGCDCDEAALAVEADTGVCGVCRRALAKCNCASKPPKYEAPTQDPVEATVREGMHYYRDTRDAMALERLLRKLAEQAYKQ